MIVNDWTIPAELDQPIPRRIKLTTRYKLAVIFCFTALFVIPNIGITYWYFVSAYPIRALKERGTTTYGNVVGTYTKASSGRGQGIEYHVKYVFLADPQSNRQSTAEGDDRVSLDAYKTLAIGKALPVIYDPSQPDISRYYPTDWIRTADWFKPMRFIILIVALSNFLSILIIVGQYSNYRKEKRFLKAGIAVSATIIEEKEYSVGFGLKGKVGHLSKLTYQFIDQDGRTVQGSRSYVPIANDKNNSIERQAILQNPTVLFDPTNSDNSFLYPTFAVACILDNNLK
jgi:hypothetical protein